MSNHQLSVFFLAGTRLDHRDRLIVYEPPNSTNRIFEHHILYQIKFISCKKSPLHHSHITYNKTIINCHRIRISIKIISIVPITHLPINNQLYYFIELVRCFETRAISCNDFHFHSSLFSKFCFTLNYRRYLS